MDIIQRYLLIDIDGLRRDVFENALAKGKLPHLARLLGSEPLSIPALAPAPSITFCSQASLFTGAHPKDHGIPGNQFFDRFGTFNNGTPIHFAFDVGDTLEVNDAVSVFTDGLAVQRLMRPTVYEKLAARGKFSVVAGNMYAAPLASPGVCTWLRPSLTNLARFTKGGNLFGISPGRYDRAILNKALNHLKKNGLPDMLTVYFMGLDHQSHKYGPGAQKDYLVHHVDPMVGELLTAYAAAANPQNPALPAGLLAVVFSDHGQIEVIPDKVHALQLGFPFEKELSGLFEALGLDVHDYPGEDPACDAVIALNGGMAHVYLHNKTEKWAAPPVFERDVLHVAQAFWDASLDGKYSPSLKNSLSGVLLRNVQKEGWTARYQALTPAGEIVALEEWFALQPPGQYSDPVNRLNNLAGLYSGDLVLLSNYADGYYFGGPIHGVHGGLHPDDSEAVLVYGWPTVDENWPALRNAIARAIETRCQAENNRQPTTADMAIFLNL